MGHLEIKFLQDVRFERLFVVVSLLACLPSLLLPLSSVAKARVYLVGMLSVYALYRVLQLLFWPARWAEKTRRVLALAMVALLLIYYISSSHYVFLLLLTYVLDVVFYFSAHQVGRNG